MISLDNGLLPVSILMSHLSCTWKKQPSAKFQSKDKHFSFMENESTGKHVCSSWGAILLKPQNVHPSSASLIYIRDTNFAITMPTDAPASDDARPSAGTGLNIKTDTFPPHFAGRHDFESLSSTRWCHFKQLMKFREISQYLKVLTNRNLIPNL